MRFDEFPENASIWPDGLSRREFLRLAGASAALAGLGACTRQPIEKMVPFVEQPENLVPGRPLFYATAMVLEGFARGILVETHEGRPTKIEGNPAHPASRGGTDVFMQAAVRDLYDPSRSQPLIRRGNVSTKGIFAEALGERMAAGGVRILTEKSTSPTLITQIKALQSQHTDIKWHHYDPLDASTVTGQNSASWSVPDLSGARIIVSLDADLFGEGPAKLAYARQWAQTRHIWQKREMSRLYVAEPSLTITGAVADDRIAVRASDIEDLARELEKTAAGATTGKEWVRKAAADLRQFGGVVVAGMRQPQTVYEIAESLSTHRPARFSPEATPANFKELTGAMAHGEVQTLLVFGGNPIRNAPVDLDFADALENVPFSVHLSVFRNETSERCSWFIPQAHFLEDWSDARAFDGTVTIQQPLIEPLYGGMSPHELLAFAGGDTATTSHDIVRAHWSTMDDAEWKRALSTGVVTEFAHLKPPTGQASTSVANGQPAVDGFEINFRPDPCMHDGRYEQNAWLQELADPLTKITWGNAVLLSDKSATELGVQNEDIVDLVCESRSIRGPVFVQTGHANKSLTVYLGHGSKHGFDVYPLRTSDTFWFGPVEIRPTGEKQRLITTQHHYQMEGRELVRHVPAATAMKTAQGKDSPEESLYPPQPLLDAENQWGMAIDLSTCFGCNACVIACQAENNIPVVGPEQVAVGREMQWIRIDTYFEEGKTHFQPVPCMHCENAPCEVVCPVAATMHDSEGLNVQVYNRCIGTRYCSNNCPYKVRRFNFLEYNRHISPSEKLQKNPNVTVRSRGVMEKCTYCIQRISAARIEAKKANRSIQDGEVIPACAQACPAEAITFGNIRDPASTVSRLKALSLNYSLLAETNVRPRTTYLAKVINAA